MVICWFKSTNRSIKDLMLVKLVLLCLNRSFLLNLKVGGKFYWIVKKMLIIRKNYWLKQLGNSPCSKGKEFMRESEVTIGINSHQETLPG